MQTLWSTSNALSIGEISKLIPKTSKGVIAEILTRLLEKKAIYVDKIKVINKSLTRTYRPKVSEEDYYTSVIPQRTLKKLVTNFISKNSSNKVHANSLIKEVQDYFNNNSDISN